VIPITEQMVAAVQDERLASAHAALAARDMRAADAVQQTVEGTRTCTSTSASVSQRVAFRLGFVPASC